MTNESRESDASPLIALALIVFMVVAGVWFLSPVCVAGLCIGDTAASAPAAKDTARVAALPPQEPQQEVKRTLHLSAPALPSISEPWAPLGEPEFIEPETSSEAVEGADLIVTDSGDDGRLTVAEQGLTSSDQEPEAAAQTSEQREAWDNLTKTALLDPDEQRRGEAIHAVSLQRHNSDALAVLSDVAMMDWDPANRYAAVRSLWSAAADGADEDGAIRELLEASLNDADESIRETAQRALDDLAALEASRVPAD